MQRFRTFEHGQKEIVDMIEFWDRTTLGIKRPPTPSERSEEDGNLHPPSGKKAKGKGDKHDKEKEKERQKQLEKENAEKAAKEVIFSQKCFFIFIFVLNNCLVNFYFLIDLYYKHVLLNSLET